MKQRKDGAKVDPLKFRRRCDVIAAYLTDVLASPVWNATIGIFASLDCMKCGHPVRKRMPHGTAKVDATCFECGATYKVTDAGQGKAHFEPDQVEVKCANPGVHDVHLSVAKRDRERPDLEVRDLRRR